MGLKKQLKRLSKWLLPVLLVGCQLEPEVVYVPEIIRDTTYVAKEAGFGLATAATLYMVSIDSVRLVYWYSLTKLDSVPVDTVFLTGLIFEWNRLRTSATMMDSTTVVVWPENAGSWIYPYEYSQGEFEAINRWHRDEWPEGLARYSIGLSYK